MPWYNYSYYALLVLGILVALKKWQRLRLALRLLAYVLILVLISEVAGRVIRNIYGNNIFVYSIVRPVTFLLVGLAFDKELKTKWIHISIVLYVIFHILNLIFFQPFGKVYDSYSTNFSLIINTIWCLSYLYYIFKQPNVESLFKFPLFWITCGYLFFNASTMIVFATLNYTINNPFKNAFIILQTIRVTASHLLYFTFLVTFLNNGLRKESF